MQYLRGAAPRLQLLNGNRDVIEELKYVPPLFWFSACLFCCWRISRSLFPFGVLTDAGVGDSIEKWNTDTLDEFLAAKMQ